jgi:hypothetical protein
MSGAMVNASGTPAELRKRANRVRQMVWELPDGDPAVARLLDFASELEGRATLLELPGELSLLPGA